MSNAILENKKLSPKIMAYKRENPYANSSFFLIKFITPFLLNQLSRKLILIADLIVNYTG